MPRFTNSALSSPLERAVHCAASRNLGFPADVFICGKRNTRAKVWLKYVKNDVLALIIADDPRC